MHTPLLGQQNPTRQHYPAWQNATPAQYPAPGLYHPTRQYHPGQQHPEQYPLLGQQHLGEQHPLGEYPIAWQNPPPRQQHPLGQQDSQGPQHPPAWKHLPAKQESLRGENIPAEQHRRRSLDESQYNGVSTMQFIRDMLKKYGYPAGLAVFHMIRKLWDFIWRILITVIPDAWKTAISGLQGPVMRIVWLIFILYMLLESEMLAVIRRPFNSGLGMVVEAGIFNGWLEGPSTYGHHQQHYQEQAQHQQPLPHEFIFTPEFSLMEHLGSQIDSLGSIITPATAMITMDEWTMDNFNWLGPLMTAQTVLGENANLYRACYKKLQQWQIETTPTLAAINRTASDYSKKWMEENTAFLASRYRFEWANRVSGRDDRQAKHRQDRLRLMQGHTEKLADVAEGGSLIHDETSLCYGKVDPGYEQALDALMIAHGTNKDGRLSKRESRPLDRTIGVQSDILMKIKVYLQKKQTTMIEYGEDLKKKGNMLRKIGRSLEKLSLPTSGAQAEDDHTKNLDPELLSAAEPDFVAIEKVWKVLENWPGIEYTGSTR